jgi:SSS family solute:Na+ symporter
MSSLASLFNSVSTLFTVDIYKKLRPQTSERTLVFVGRVTTVAMTFLGIVWVPVMKAISTGGLYQYIQAVQSFLAPPIVAVFLMGLLWKRMNLRGATWGLSLGFVLGMGKLSFNALAKGSSSVAGAIAAFPDLYFSGVLLLLSILVIVIASLSAPAPDAVRLTGLTYACLDEAFKRENRLSWNWVDVAGTLVVLGAIAAAYAYFWTWLD